MTRYVYIKDGDGAGELRKFCAGARVTGSGPDAFVFGFLERRRDDEVAILCRWAGGDRFQQERFRAHALADQRRPGIGGVLWRVSSALRIGLEIMRAKPDRILSGSTGELLWVAVAAAKLLRVPIVNSRHNELKQREGAARLQSLLDHASIRACDAVVCHGPYTADQVRAIGVPPSKIYPFEVNLEEFVSDATEYAVPKSISEFAAGRDPLYTFVGRVQENKGVFDLLRAFSSLRGSLPRAGLCYVGDGSDLAALEDEAERLGLADDVLFAGRIAHEDLPGILRASTVVVTPTRPDFPEGRCMAVLEAMAAGTPAIAPRFGAFPYAIDHETSGLLFAPGDPEDLGKCLVRVARDPVLLARLRAGARQATRQLVLSYVSFGEAIDAAFGHSMLEAGSESKEQARA